MESLADILSGGSAPADSGKTASASDAKAPEAKSEPAKDVKPDQAKADAAKATAAPDASATSAEQAKTESKATEAKPEKSDKAAEGEGTDSQPRTDGRNELGQFKSVAELQAELNAAKRASSEERRKRQDIQRQLQEAQQGTKPKDEKPKTDFWTDPDAALDERLTEREQTLRRETDTRFFNLCEEAAREKHADYEDVVSELMEETGEDESLAQQVFAAARAAKNPALYLYKTAVNRREMKAHGGDLAKYKESIAEPFKAQVAERDQTITGLQKEVKSLKDQLEKIGKVPASLNAEPSASRGAVASEAAENESLGEIFKPSKRRA